MSAGYVDEKTNMTKSTVIDSAGSSPGEKKKFMSSEDRLNFLLGGETKAASISDTQHVRANIANIPNEILIRIFHYFHPVFSTCAGPTCKRLYAIHRSLHGTVELLHRVYWCVERWPNYDAWRPLHYFLKEWMGEDRVYYELVGIIVTRRGRGLWRRGER